MPVLALGIGFGIVGCAYREYNEQIEDKKISYTEIWGLPAAKNIMKVSTGDTSYVFEDFSARVFGPAITSIDWETKTEPNFRKDVLNWATIEYPGFISKYSESDINDNTIEGRHKKVVFNNMNNWYHQLRGQLRDSLRARYERA